MSTDQNAVTQTGPPRRFLRKGEGLKRFAAYKPPLPTTAKKVERRQTFVRFKIDQKCSNTRREPAHFVPPDILNDDSINLSTEIPKIAPPKIIHTPIRPNRHALGTITNESSFFNSSQINGNIDSLFKKIEEKKSALQEREEKCFNDLTTSFDYQDLDDNANENHIHDDTKDNNDTDHNHDNDKQHVLEIKDKEKHEKQSTPETPQLPTERPPQHRVRSKRAGRIADLSTPAPGTGFVALGRQISEIEKTVNELREKLKNCECGAMAQQQLPQTTRRRPTTRAAAKAAQSKASDAKPDGPLVNADNNPIEKLILSLADNVAQLRVRYDEEMDQKRRE